MKSISCVIPTCDRGSVLLEAIESAARQTRPPEEILVINNGSRTIDLPHTLAERVKVHNIVAYAGPSQARNFGACVAMGDYLAFLDDDEIWDRRYLEYAAGAIDRGAKLIIGRLDELCEDSVRPYKNVCGNLTIQNILVRNPGVNGSNLVVERKLFYELRGFDVKLPPSEDKSFVLEALLRGISIDTLPDSQVLLRKGEGVRLTSDPAKMAEGVWQFTRKYSQYMTTDELLLNVEKAYRYRKAAAQAAEAVRGAPTPSHESSPCLSGEAKRSLVRRLLNGESIEGVSKESRVSAEELAKWKRVGELIVRMALMETFAGVAVA